MKNKSQQNNKPMMNDTLPISETDIKQKYENIIKTEKEYFQNKIKSLKDEMRGIHDTNIQKIINKIHSQMTKRIALLTKQMNKELEENKELSKIQEKTQDEDLKKTQSKIELLKSQYETSIKSLHQDLLEANTKLENNNQVITQLKDEKTQLLRDIEDLKEKHKMVQHELKSYEKQQSELKKEARRSNMDSDEFKLKSQQLSTQHSNLMSEEKRITESLQEHKEKVIQYKASIKQLQEQMKIDKEHFIQLRAQYEDQKNKITSLQEALHDCQTKQGHSQQIIEALRSKYNELDSKSKEMIDDMKRLLVDKQDIQNELKKEQNRVKELESNLAIHQADLKSKITQNKQHHYHKIEECNNKTQECLQNNQARDEYIKKLEKDLQEALKLVKSTEKKHNLDINQQFHEELTVITDHIKQIQHENKVYKKLLSALEEKHQKNSLLTDNFNNENDIKEKKQTSDKKVEETNKMLDQNENKIQRLAHTIKKLEKREIELTEKISKCLYPGEKERLENEITSLIQEKNEMRNDIAKLIENHNKLNKKLLELQKENETLKILKEKYDLDVEQLNKLALSSSTLNDDLSQCKKLLVKKDKQLELLGNQLAPLITRIQVLEEREKKLNQQLSTSTSATETDALQTKLTSCKSELASSLQKSEELFKIVKILEQQNKANYAKIENLLEVIKERQDVKALYKAEIEAKNQLKEALKRCADDHTSSTKELQDKLLIIEEQYKKSVTEHELFVNSSNKKIQELQNQLDLAIQKEKAIISPQQIIQQTSSSSSSTSSSSSSSSSTSQSSPELSELEKKKEQHRQLLREKEKEILELRENTYNQFLAELETTNSTPKEIQGDDLLNKLKQIQKLNAQREQEKMQDMLQLRAINEKLNTQSKLTRETQQKLLSQANERERKNILNSANQYFSTPNSNASGSFLENLQAYQKIVDAQKNNMNDDRFYMMNELKRQQQYIEDLQRQIPKINAIEQNMNALPFPQLNNFRQQLGQEKKYILGALRNEQLQATGQERSLSALESQLQAANASVRSLTDYAKQLAKQPVSSNFDMLKAAASTSIDQLANRIQQNNAMNDKSDVRTNVIVPASVVNSNAMQVDTRLNKIQLQNMTNPNSNNVPNQFFPSNVSVVDDNDALTKAPISGFAPTISRAVDAMSNQQDLIVVTYSFSPPNASDTKLKYNMFLNAVRQLWPTINSMKNNLNQLNIQIVVIQDDGARLDVIGQKSLPTNCNSRQCNSTKLLIDDVNTVENFMKSIDFKQSSGSNSTHTILTINDPNNVNSNIFIVDVLYKQVPDDAELKLLDNSWITYLSDILQDPQVKFDLFFNMLPHTDSDMDIIKSNERLLNISTRLQEFLKQLKTMTNK